MNVRLYEREAAVEAIRRLLDAAIDGHGGSVFVVAAAGLGKTSVLQTAVTAASGRFDVRAGGGMVGPLLSRDGIAVQRLRARPRPGGAKHHPARQREPQEIGQLRVPVGVDGDQQLHDLQLSTDCGPAGRRYISYPPTGRQDDGHGPGGGDRTS